MHDRIHCGFYWLKNFLITVFAEMLVWWQRRVDVVATGDFTSIKQIFHIVQIPTKSYKLLMWTEILTTRGEIQAFSYFASAFILCIIHSLMNLTPCCGRSGFLGHFIQNVHNFKLLWWFLWISTITIKLSGISHHYISNV